MGWNVKEEELWHKELAFLTPQILIFVARNDFNKFIVYLIFDLIIAKIAKTMSCKIVSAGVRSNNADANWLFTISITPSIIIIFISLVFMAVTIDNWRNILQGPYEEDLGGHLHRSSSSLVEQSCHSSCLARSSSKVERCVSWRLAIISGLLDDWRLTITLSVSWWLAIISGVSWLLAIISGLLDDWRLL